jgi:D-alanyl-D-alanine carboxypeptidase/D-alanyl-D-alanine-endopeptidase (penicillin-binding protein 4)
VAADGGARRATLVVLTGLLVVAAVTVAGLDLSGRLPGGLVADPASSPTATPTLDPPRSPAPSVLPPEPTAPGPAPVLPEAALDEVLASPALGGAAGAVVVDVATGQVLLDRDAAAARIPASVAKLATAAGVLTALGPEHRVATRVLAGADVAGGSSVVLVGAGDATLTTRRSRPGDLPQRASLSELADQVVAAMSPGTSPLTVLVDDSMFTGPAVSPDWPATYLSSGVVSPVSALSVDAGRVRPGSVAREADPALAAGRELARLLRSHGVEVRPDITRGTAAENAPVVAEAVSPTVAEMVELSLQTSDNDLAEALLRLAAVGQGQPATFDGGTAAVLGALSSLGVPTEGMELLDGSGLARDSAVPPGALARLLLLAADGAHPHLAPLLDGLPVAGFSGTLETRYLAGAPAAAAGLLRAKTGTLTGVSALAGTTSTGGRPVVFVVMSDRVPEGATQQARDDLDRFAAVLSGAGGAENLGTPGG